jgi:hypothetical protein
MPQGLRCLRAYMQGGAKEEGEEEEEEKIIHAYYLTHPWDGGV